MFRHILLATDGSEASGHAARLAVGLARAHGARLTAVYVVDPYPYLGMGEANPLGFQAYMGAAAEHAAAAHAAVLTLCAESPRLEPQLRRIEDAAAASGIVATAQAEDCDLIVVGSHGRSGLQRLVLGSVAAKVVAQSEIPVLVAR